MTVIIEAEGEPPLPDSKEGVDIPQHTRFVTIWRRDILGLSRSRVLPVLISRNGAAVLGQLRA